MRKSICESRLLLRNSSYTFILLGAVPHHSGIFIRCQLNGYAASIHTLLPILPSSFSPSHPYSDLQPSYIIHQESLSPIRIPPHVSRNSKSGQPSPCHVRMHVGMLDHAPGLHPQARKANLRSIDLPSRLTALISMLNGDFPCVYVPTSDSR
ncbi:hypothetical protein BCR34DRAFT_79776 [Clohesyomyces aquaticus]|uniref:Uncharacterized protein n=1 Tax=Clohesyomyces aquaticus TaxID=1231657 RepID=A0A1Y1YXC3_9PLEO|nr:hypothetical protein BCR34DRAFT_79776 [Clohesyomyces aquaticus]